LYTSSMEKVKMTAIITANDNVCRTPKNTISHLIRAFIERRRQKRSMREMLSYGDHILADIGVTRFDIQHALHEDDGRSCSERLTRIVDENRRAYERRMRELPAPVGSSMAKLAA